MTSSHPAIVVLTHYQGDFQLAGGAGFQIARTPAWQIPGTELEPPPALVTMPPGELLEIAEADDTQKPLVLASHGRQADLSDKRELIDMALESGRSVEIHVFDTLSKES
jgi:hypothetical protein